MNAGIEELEKSLAVEQRRLSEYQREQERLEEKLPIVKDWIQNTETKILEIETSLELLKQNIGEE